MRAVALAAIPSSLRRLNERTVLERLRRLGTASRADLAKAAGISQPTAGKIIEELLAFGLLEELDEDDPANATTLTLPPRLGRPGRRLRLDTTQPRFLAVELGVEQTRLACLPLAAPGVLSWQAAFPTGPSPEAWLASLRTQAAQLPRATLWAVLVSVPGVVDEGTGRVLYSPNLHWTERLPLADLVAGVWSLPVRLVQEIRALALGHLAATPGCENFLLVDFGEGVGGAIIEGGQLLRHPLPLSAELGHTPVLGNPRLCGCGATGCVETLLSRTGLCRSLGEPSGSGPAGLEALVRRLQSEGLPDWLGNALDAMGAILAGALNVLGLRRIVVTGHLTELPAAALERLAQAVRRGSMWARFGEVICEPAPRRRLGGLIAAGIDRLLFPTSSEGPLPEATRRRMAETSTRTSRRNAAPQRARPLPTSRQPRRATAANEPKSYATPP
jgi:predicted NBD/HSP70 family sugar kinase